MGLFCNLLPPAEIKLTATAHLLVFSRDGKFLLTCHDDQGNFVWDVSRIQPAQKLELEASDDGTLPAVRGAAFVTTPGLHLVLAHGLDHPTQQFCLVEGRYAPYVPPVRRYPNADAVEASHDGASLAFATAQAIEIRATGSGQLIRTLDLQRDAVVLTFSPDARHLATADAQSRLRIMQLDGDDVLESTLARLMDGSASDPRQLALDTERGWRPVEIAWASASKDVPPSALNPGRQEFGVVVTSRRVSGPEAGVRFTRWHPHAETFDVPLVYSPLDTRYKEVCLAPNATFCVCVTAEDDLEVRDTALRTGYSVGLKGRVGACGFSPDSSRVAFSCLKHGMDAKQKGKALLSACRRGDEEAVRDLLRELDIGPDQPRQPWDFPGDVPEEQRTPCVSSMLYEAVGGQHIAMVNFLSATFGGGLDGGTMSCAVSTGNASLVEALCRQHPGAANAVVYHNTILAHACAKPENAEIVRVLLRAGADTNSEPMHALPWSDAAYAVSGGLPASIIEDFFDHGYRLGDPWAVSFAITHGRADVLEVLFRRGKDLPSACIAPKEDLIRRARDEGKQDMVDAIERLYPRRDERGVLRRVLGRFRSKKGK